MKVEVKDGYVLSDDGEPMYKASAYELALAEERDLLKDAIQKHKDRYIFSIPDYEDLELWKTIERNP